MRRAIRLFRVARRSAPAVFAGAVVLAVGFAALSGAGTKSSTTPLDGLEDGSAKVRCKQGQRVVAVGARGEVGDEVMAGDPVVTLNEVARPARRRARVSGSNRGTDEGDLTAIVRCKKRPRAKITSASTSVPPAGMESEVESVTAKCPPGTRIVFGGFRTEFRPSDAPDNPIVFPTAAKRTGPRDWTVEGTNLADGPDDAGDLTALAYCGDVESTQKRTATTSTDAFDVGVADARCPRGTKLRYGGFDGTNPQEAVALTFLNAFHRLNNRTFRASHLAFAGAADLTAIAYCR
jgi:hypothetical protein